MHVFHESLYSDSSSFVSRGDETTMSSFTKTALHCKVIKRNVQCHTITKYCHYQFSW